MRADVAIIGGGPVGLGLAIELGLRGVSTVVVERAAQMHRVPKGQNLTQRTLEHFHFWGAEKALRAARTIPPEYGIGGVTAYGSLLGDYSYDWLQRDLVRAFYYTDNERLPQYATETVLRARAAELPQVRTLYGFNVESIEQDEAGAAVEAVEAGTRARLRIEADWLVGCDGSRSMVRQAAGIGEGLSDHRKPMVLLVFTSPQLHALLLQRFPGKSFFNVLNPELDGYWQFFGRVDLGSRWFFHAPAPEGAMAEGFDFRPYLARAIGAPFDFDLEYVGFWDLRVAIADRYRQGRVFIAGDAAHSHPPYGGYGINTGLEDAVNLGWKLAAVRRGWAGPRLLDSYDEERRPVFESTARDFIEKAISTDRAFLHAFDPDRDREAFEAEWRSRREAARWEVDAFEPNYEGSSIVRSAAGRPGALGRHLLHARPGHHLAPHILADGRNVFEVLGRDFTLLTFGADRREILAFQRLAEARGIPLSVVSERRGGEARQAYGAALVLVRPDQFVAWRGDDAAEAEAALSCAVGEGLPELATADGR
jgi:2-polyprenyl-6-methoxyphenol hydroxylase-like FAD-dependent oxidoreductase